jgi:hypothetical protein
MINFANTDKSKRLAPILAMLRRRLVTGATTLELSCARAGTVDLAVHTSIAEIRANGYKIACHFDGRMNDGRKIYRYFYKGTTK